MCGNLFNSLNNSEALISLPQCGQSVLISVSVASSLRAVCVLFNFDVGIITLFRNRVKCFCEKF